MAASNSPAISTAFALPGLIDETKADINKLQAKIGIRLNSKQFPSLPNRSFDSSFHLIEVDLIRARASLFKVGDIADRGFGDIFQSFLGEESLMSGNQDVRESQQALKNIVLNNVI